MTNEEMKEYIRESNERDAARRAKLIAEIKAEYPALDIENLHTSGSLYGDFRVYIDNTKYICNTGICVYEAQTALGSELEWDIKFKSKVATVEVGIRTYRFSSLGTEKASVNVFYTKTGERVKGERFIRTVHQTAKGTYVELNGKRYYLDFQEVAVAEVIEEIKGEEKTMENTLTVGNRVNHKTYGNGTVVSLHSWNTLEVLFDTFRRSDRANGCQLCNYTELGPVADSLAEKVRAIAKLTKGAPMAVVLKLDGFGIHIGLQGTDRGSLHMGQDSGDGYSFILGKPATDIEIEQHAEAIVDTIKEWLPADALEAWGYKPYIFMMGKDDEITSDTYTQVIEDYESEDMSVAYQVVRAMVKPGTLLKQLGGDNIERYAIADADGNVEAWNPLENMVVYVERPSLQGHKVYVLNARYNHLGEWFYRNPIDGTWLKREPAPSRESINSLTGASIRLNEIKGSKREEIIASWLQDQLDYLNERGL